MGSCQLLLRFFFLCLGLALSILFHRFSRLFSVEERFKGMLITMKFIRMVLDGCFNKPLIIVDRGSWYMLALDRIGLKYQY